MKPISLLVTHFSAFFFYLNVFVSDHIMIIDVMDKLPFAVSFLCFNLFQATTEAEKTDADSAML